MTEDDTLRELARTAELALANLNAYAATSGVDVTITESVHSQDALSTSRTHRVRLTRRIYPQKEPQ